MIFNFMVTLFVKLLFITTTDMYTIQLKAGAHEKKIKFFFHGLLIKAIKMNLHLIITRQIYIMS